MLPDGDRDVKLEWAEGGSSDYVKLNRLRKSNESNFKNAQKAKAPWPINSFTHCWVHTAKSLLPPSLTISLYACPLGLPGVACGELCLCRWA